MSPEDTPGDSTKGAGQAAEAPVKHPIYVVHEQSGGEVDLMDIVDVIVCRWTAIAAVTLLFLLAGYAYIVIALDVYRSEAMLTLTPQQAGGGADGVVIDGLGEVSEETLRNVFLTKAQILKAQSLLVQKEPELREVIAETLTVDRAQLKMHGLFVSFEFKASTPDLARKSLEAILQTGLERTQSLYRQDIERSLNALDLKLDNSKKQVDTLQKELSLDPVHLEEGTTPRIPVEVRTGNPPISINANDSDAITKVNLLIQIQNEKFRLFDLELKKVELETLLDNIEGRLPIKILEAPNVSDRPETKRAALVLAGSLIFGLLGGVLIALFLDKYFAHREKLRQAQTPA